MMEDEESILREMRDSLAELNMDATNKACLKGVEAGIDPYRCVIEGLSPGMEIVGDKYERREYFLMELIMAGEIMNEAIETLEPYLKASGIRGRTIGKVVIGAVKGDLHDIGKSIVISLLRANNFEVIDIGSDVSAEKFVEEVRTQKPNILGLSALLTTTLKEMETVTEKLQEAGLRKKVKIIIGGGAVYESFAEKIGADSYSTDAVTGVEQCKRWVSKSVRG